MTPDQVTLVQQSFAKVAPISETAAVLFYDRLFEIAPSVKPMFPTDLKEQRKKLMATLAVVVNGLNNLDSVLPAASALAKRHVSYGAQARALSRRRGRFAVDAGKGIGRRLDPRGRLGLDLGVRHVVRLHDCRSLRPIRISS